MLVLSRKKNEDIIIGEGENQVRLMIVEIRGDKVRLGIDADRSVPVHRKEVYDAIEREKNGGK
jgi:carbon storage regulator